MSESNRKITGMFPRLFFRLASFPLLNAAALYLYEAIAFRKDFKPYERISLLRYNRNALIKELAAEGHTKLVEEVKAYHG